MPLSDGTRIGPYEILHLTGAGGMGEVYRARDTRLNRDIAIKVLPPAAQAHPDRLSRFQREAHLLATLNHPNIAAVHGLEENDGFVALVMEFVEGRTLADLIARSRSSPGGSQPDALSLTEALAIAKQIADALEAAHEHGIIHRDLKPANVIVRHDGVVKVLDFGLAKMLDQAPETDSSPDDIATVTSPAMTRHGELLGTAAYMSPEQARGRPVDKRADIWAFGVVLYEMVTGRRPFQGEHVTDVLAAIVKDQPDLSGIPSSVRRLIEKCLEKDPRKRLRDISSVELLLDESQTITPVAPPALRSKTSRVAAVVAAMVLIIATVAATLLLQRRGAPDPAVSAIEFAIEPPPGTSFASPHSAVAVSPDGKHLVFSAAAAGAQPALWLRQLGSVEARLLTGTEGATAPVWSPDGKSIAFMAERKLKRLDLAGGAPVLLADVPRADLHQPPAWSQNGTILFGCPCGLDAVPASGGPLKTLRAVDREQQETAYGAPQFLPDGDRFLYLVSSPDPKIRGIYASSLADPSQRTRILNTDAKATYVPPRGNRPGYLVWVEVMTLHARPFDADALQWIGDPVSIADGLSVAITQPPRAAFWTSDNGMLIFLRAPFAPVRSAASDNQIPERGQPRNLPIAWYSRDGTHLGDAAPDAPYNAIAIAPDQQRAALTRFTFSDIGQQTGNIWVRDFRTNVDGRVSFGSLTDENPVWAPDGRQLIFSSNRDGKFYQLYRQNASGAGDAERLLTADKHMDPLDWSPDGRFLVYREMNQKTGWDLMLLPLGGERTPITLVQTPQSDSDARFSPDGRWLAYHSRLNGRSLEVFVQAFRGQAGLTGERVQVSDGGAAPLWGPAGRELYYQKVITTAFAPQMMAVSMTYTPRVQASMPRELFTADMAEGIHTKAVTSDGTKFLIVLKPRTRPQPARLNVVTDWQSTIRR